MTRIEINYLCETETALETFNDTVNADDNLFHLVDKQIFIVLFQSLYPESVRDAYALWDVILGNHPEDEAAGIHPDVHFLTNHSAEKILAHYPLFLNGIDYQNLPSGFFLTKNPEGAGVRDVLHYSDFIAMYQANPSPFAVIVAAKGMPNPLLGTRIYPEPQASWYRFLCAKATTIEHQYCSQKELDDAFVQLLNLIENLDLNFYAPDFALLGEDCNPIVLMGRWATVLRNPNLKVADRNAQWQCLLQLPLTRSYEGIRAITDNRCSLKPCGFLLPQMQLDSVTGLSYDHFDYERRDWRRVYLGVKTVTDYHRIDSEQNFWRYLSFQTKRNSIGFYRTALNMMPNVAPEYQYRLWQMLAAGSSDLNHAVDAVTESRELEIWQNTCQLIASIAHKNLVMRTIDAMSGGQMQSRFLAHLTRLQTQPNLIFLHSIAEHISNYLANLGAADFAIIAAGGDPLRELEQLSDQLESVIRSSKSKIYQGMRFYFWQGVWQQMNIKSYIELQDYLGHRYVIGANLFAPYLSTFNIQTEAALEAALALIGPGTNLASLSFCLDIFNDANAPLNQESLHQLIQTINQGIFQQADYEAMLNYLHGEFAHVFPEHYFALKIEQMRDARHGLTAAQITLLDNYQFSNPAKASIVRIESALLRHDMSVRNDDLEALNEQLNHLNEIIMPDEFELFLERISSIREHISHKEILRDLFVVLIREKSLLNFNSIFLREKVVPCEQGNLFLKIQQYMLTLPYLTQKNLKINPIKLQELMAGFFLRLSPQEMQQDFVRSIKNALDGVYEIILSHPHVQDQVIDLINALTLEEQAPYLASLEILLEKLRLLNAFLPSGTEDWHIENMAMFYSLTAHFSKKPADFIALLETVFALPNDEMKRFFLSLASKLLDSNHSIEGLNDLVLLCSEDLTQFETLKVYCESPPYPSIVQAIDWLAHGTFEENYQAYSLRPFAERRLHYTFNRAHFYEQAPKFIGLVDDFFTDDLANTLQRCLDANRAKSIQTLRDELSAFQSLPLLNEAQDIELLCLCVEFLARTCYQADAQSVSGFASQEMNSTQIMTLVAMMMQDCPKILNQIDTGEGKSRIMMVLAAFQALKGKTVDFITSDMQLASRDFFVFKQFFTALGIRSSLISLKTPPQLYQKGGVNFSDNAQLLLLRNKSDIDERSFDYLIEDKSNRCLLIDEVDRFIHDKAQDAYNYANKSRRLSGYLWIYPLLVSYMERAENDLTYVEGRADFNALIEPFINYCNLHDTNQGHLASLAEMQRVSPEQLSIWLQSAHTALHMENLRDYVLTEEGDDKLIAVRDHEGFTRYTRKILVLNNGRPMEGSSFADGVQQCLCVIENKKSARADSFVILAENETQRSSYTKTFVAQYDTVLGVSGTTRFEAPTADVLINRENYKYIVTPRERVLNRQDKNVLAAKDEAQQLVFVKREILKAMRQDRSCLLICKDDQQSERFNRALQADRGLQNAVNNWQYVHSLSSSHDEKIAIDTAGEARTLTISTAGMFARGVDINAAHMEVVAAFVPSFEEEIQIKGRSGRFGRPGTYRMIPNINDEDRSFKGNTYRVENEINALQSSLAMSAVSTEEVASIYSDFLECVHQAFLQTYQVTPKINQLKMLTEWQLYLGEMQKDWVLKQQDMLALVIAEQEQAFIDSFSTFSEKWMAKLPVGLAFDLQSSDQLSRDVYQKLLAQKGFFRPRPQPLKVQADYDIADDGQARVYSSLFVQTRAVLRGERSIFADFHAWRDGRGELFPDLMATLYGDRPIFANLRATINRLIQELLTWIKEWREGDTNEPLAHDLLQEADFFDEDLLDDGGNVP